MAYLIPQLIFSLGIIGALVIFIFIFVMNGIYKYSAVITVPIMILVGVDYFNYYSTSNSTLIWLGFLSWLVAVISALQLPLRRK